MSHGPPRDPAPPRCPEAWSGALSLRLGRPVQLTYGGARRNVIVARSAGERLEVRLNRYFARAPAHVAEALAAWLRSGKRAGRARATLDNWIEEVSAGLGPPARRAPRIQPVGTHLDLRPLTREVVALHLADELDTIWDQRVTWGRRSSRKGAPRRSGGHRRSLRLGSYDPERNLIRIHPVLDQPAVPRFFVRYVLFHELLHAAFSGEVHTRPHPPAFREREREYPDHARALRWQANSIGALIESARTHQPLPRAR